MNIKWQAQLNDPSRTIIHEDDKTPSGEPMRWDILQKMLADGGYCIVKFKFIVDGKEINLPPNMDDYFQGTSASADLGSGKVTIISRYIGYTCGNINVQVSVDATNGNISVFDFQ